MGLTPSQDRFARLIVEGKSQAEAYREAYPKSQRWTDKAVWNRSSALAAHSEVLGRVSELRQAAADATKMTLESHLKELELLRDMAKEQGNINAAIHAETVRGKHSGVAAATKLDVKQPPVYKFVIGGDDESN